MTQSTLRPTQAPETQHGHTAFLKALPRIQLHGRVYFRHLKNTEQREEFLAEMVALAWLWFVRLLRDGRNPGAFISTLATFAARAAGSGRRLCGQEKANEVLSRRAQRIHGFTIQTLPTGTLLGTNPLEETLQDNTQTLVPEQVCFRCDFPQWYQQYQERDRLILADLMQGERTANLAHRYSLSPGRISQLRNEFQADWEMFCADSSER